MSRPSWDRTWLDVADVIARRSRCSRSQVGAVIVDAMNRVVATGYNGPPANWEGVASDSCTDWCDRGRSGPTTETIVSYVDCPSSHAEINALMFVDRRVAEGGTIYITGHVCWTCAKAIANSGLKRVVVRDDQAASHRTPERSYELLERSRIEVSYDAC